MERAFDIFVERVLGKSKTGLKLRILREFRIEMEFEPMAFIVYEPSKLILSQEVMKPLDVAKLIRWVSRPTYL